MDDFDFDFATISIAPDNPSRDDDPMRGYVPVDEDSQSRAGVYCVIA
ncbi:B mating type pheromone [Trametes versicolor FP-101664 SS1]|nr:B mating type pheromone [Trametes versicolor FP-101664 SS1]EIW57113.1 B mating type pheromone [Trametes versicolor FP-101664 SS1]